MAWAADGKTRLNEYQSKSFGLLANSNVSESARSILSPKINKKSHGTLYQSYHHTMEQLPFTCIMNF